MNASITTLAIALILTACGSSSSSSPPTVPSPTVPPASPARTNWNVTQTFVSVTGPDNCWVREQRARLTGAIFGGLPMSVDRSNGTVALQSEFFQVNYAGTITGTEFSASGIEPLTAGGRACVEGTIFHQMPGVSNLSGRFASDDQSMTATEVNSYRLDSGEPVTYMWDWKATRRN